MATQTITKALCKSFDQPDEVREFNHGRLELLNMEDLVVGKTILKPGWRWSKDVKPLVHTDSCQAQHMQYVISGRLVVVLDDGVQLAIKAGDTVLIPPGHDAWVVGDEDFVAVDFAGMKDYARELTPETTDVETEMLEF